MLKIIEIDPSVALLVDECHGYCPCSCWHEEEWLCPCLEFRQQDVPGQCNCGRYEKVETDADSND